MELTKEQVESKKAEYVSQRNQLQLEVANAQAKLNAYDGAIQDCDYWLGQLTE